VSTVPGPIALLLLLLAACQPGGPRPIAFGEEACTHCHMTVTDARFTAEAVTSTGRIFVFDDIGCLTDWLRETDTPIRGAWVASFVAPGSWLAADSAAYLAPEALRSPMSSGLIALQPGTEADSVRRALGGRLRDWAEIRDLPAPRPESR